MTAPPKLRLFLEITRTFLAGGKEEYNPYVEYRGSWPEHGDSKTTPVFSAQSKCVDLGLFQLPVENNSTGSNLWFQQFSDTNKSGIAAIDLKEGAHRVRNLKAGGAHVDLWMVMRELKRNKVNVLNIPLPGIDHLLRMQFIQRGTQHAIGEDKTALADPVRRLGEARVNQIDHYSALLALKAEYVLWVGLPAAFNGRVGAAPTTTPMEMIQQAIMGRMETAYWGAATDFPPPSTMENVAEIRFPANPKDPLVRDLHLAGFDSPAGRLLPMLHVLEQSLQPGQFKLEHVELCLLNALEAKGATQAEFMHTVSEQLAPEKWKDKMTSAAFLTVPEVILGIVTPTANAVDYTSDMRFPNLAALIDMPANLRAIYSPETAKFDFSKVKSSDYIQEYGAATAVPTALASAFHTPATTLRLPTCLSTKMRLVGERFSWILKGKALAATALSHRLHYRKHTPIHHLHAANPALNVSEQGVKSLAELSLVFGDMWDREVLAMVTNSGDCEDVASAIVRMLNRIKEELNRPNLKLNPLLTALRNALNLFVPAFGAATVSEPYVDTSKAAAPQVHVELPLYGDEQSQQWKEGGHALALLIPARRCAEMYLAGLSITKFKSLEDYHAIRGKLEAIINALPEWNSSEHILVGEGTGAVAPYILPVKETYAGFSLGDEHARKAEAKINLARFLHDRTRIDGQELADLVRIQTQPFEVERRSNLEQHISQFYRTLVHVIVPEYYQLISPLMVHSIMVNSSTRERGLSFADVLRNRNSPSLVSWCAHEVTHPEWIQDFHGPMMHALAQLPSSSWGVRGMPQLKQRALPLSGIPFGAAVATAHGPAPSLRALGSFSRPDRTTLSMTIPAAWKFKALGPEKVQKAILALEKLKSDGAIIAYDVLSDVPLERSGEVFHLILTLPVPAR